MPTTGTVLCFISVELTSVRLTMVEIIDINTAKAVQVLYHVHNNINALSVLQ